MTLAEAISSFIRLRTQNESSAESSHQPLELLTVYFPGAENVESITPERLRDFLARWYVEKASSSYLPAPESLLGSLSHFFKWAGEHNYSTTADECLAVVKELEQNIPRALEITEKLSKQIAERGGPFIFPEFLTSFEGGGSSQYDLDAPGEVGAIEGYFRITRVEGPTIEAVDTISEERVWPIILPEGVAGLIRAGFIINLELVRSGEGWQIAACGFAYPPGTEV